ncbi:MAG: hypothetical protein P4M06_13575 [Pandoraea sp.]|nr:hypothetical protein [Pandoraea sp.]MDR3398574.1 hypothetical protein [Pandoraea sp.]
MITARVWLSAMCLVLSLTSPTGVAYAATARQEMPENAPRPMPVGVALSLLDVQGIRENINTLYATVEFRQTWQDPRLAFDPIRQGSERIVHTDREALRFLDEHWNPAIKLTNQVSTTGTPQIGVEIRPDGSVTRIDTINAGFYIRSDYSDFPFDWQAYPIDIASDRYNQDQLTLVHGAQQRTASVIAPSVHLAQWTLTGLAAERSNPIGWDGTRFDHVALKVIAKRNTTQYAPQLFLPYMFIMMAPLIVLVLKVDNVVQRATMLSSAALATIALQFTVAAGFPEVVLTDNIVSRMFWLGYAFLVTMLLLVITIYNPTLRLFRDPHVAEEMRKQLNWIPAAIFLVLLFGTVLSPILRQTFA